MRLLVLSAALLALPQDDLANKIVDLSARLGDASFDVREQATNDLVAIGKPALEAMKALAGHADPEVRSRAEQVARRIREALNAKALQLQVTLDPAVPRADQPVKVTVRLVNGSDDPLVVARVMHAPLFSPDLSFRLLRGGKSLFEAEIESTRSFMTCVISEGNFLTLQPGESSEACAFTVGGAGVTTPAHLVPVIRTKDDAADRRPLEAGAHRLQAAYAFTFVMPPRPDAKSSKVTWRLENGQAAELYAKVWRGTATADVAFTVTGPGEQK